MLEISVDRYVQSVILTTQKQNRLHRNKDMIKSPTQWSKAFKKLATSEDVIVNVQLTIDQLKELTIMMNTLSLHVSVDSMKEILETEV